MHLLKLLLSCGTLAYAADFSSYDCNKCEANKGKVCLDDTDFTKSTCCDPSEPATCLSSDSKKYCANYNTGSISNSVLKNWFCAAN